MAPTSFTTATANKNARRDIEAFGRAIERTAIAKATSVEIGIGQPFVDSALE